MHFVNPATGRSRQKQSAKADIIEGYPARRRSHTGIPTCTAETHEVCQLILSSVHRALGEDQAQDIVRSAADAVLETLKNDTLKDFRKVGNRGNHWYYF